VGQNWTILKFITPVYDDAEKRSIYENGEYFIWNIHLCFEINHNEIIIAEGQWN